MFFYFMNDYNIIQLNNDKLLSERITLFKNNTLSFSFYDSYDMLDLYKKIKKILNINLECYDYLHDRNGENLIGFYFDNFKIIKILTKLYEFDYNDKDSLNYLQVEVSYSEVIEFKDLNKFIRLNKIKNITK